MSPARAKKSSYRGGDSRKTTAITSSSYLDFGLLDLCILLCHDVLPDAPPVEHRPPDHKVARRNRKQGTQEAHRETCKGKVHSLCLSVGPVLHAEGYRVGALRLLQPVDQGPGQIHENGQRPDGHETLDQGEAIGEGTGDHDAAVQRDADQCVHGGRHGDALQERDHFAQELAEYPFCG